MARLPFPRKDGGRIIRELMMPMEAKKKRPIGFAAWKKK
jgi:hypothetical protein